MTTSEQAPDDALASLVAALTAGWAAAPAAPAGLADDAVVATMNAELVGRLADGLRVRAAGMVAAESAAGFGAEGLARRNGFTSTSSFLAALTGSAVSTATKRLKLAEATHTTTSLVGLPNPPRFPAVERALSLGTLGLDAAVVITRRLSDAARRCGFTDDVALAETTLVELSERSSRGLLWSADELNVCAHRLVAHLDPDGALPAETAAHDRRSLTLRDLHDGTWLLKALLPNEHAQALRDLLQATTNPRTAPTFTAAAPTPAIPTPVGAALSQAPDVARSLEPADPSSASPQGAAARTGGASELDEAPATPPDKRSPQQKQLDAFVGLFALIAGHPDVPNINGAVPTISVHADLDDIVSGRGLGWVDGLAAPLSAATVQRLLCHSDIVTTLLGDKGQVLQHGKTRRLFTPAQRRAMAARDGGCVWPGCSRPPSWCEAHHVVEWTDGSFLPGRTDIDNGVLLCHRHHHDLHHTDWKLTMIDGVPNIVPPHSIDASQTPTPCTKQRTRTRTRTWRPPGPAATPSSTAWWAHGSPPPARDEPPNIIPGLN